MLTAGVTPSIHVDYKHSAIKQYFKLGHALRTEMTVNDAGDFGIGRRLHNLPALARIGFKANRRLLDAQRISCDPLTGIDAYEAVCHPLVVESSDRARTRVGRKIFAEQRRLAVKDGARRSRNVVIGSPR